MPEFLYGLTSQSVIQIGLEAISNQCLISFSSTTLAALGTLQVPSQLPVGSAFFANFSFLLLFIAMTAYWISLAFAKTTNPVPSSRGASSSQNTFFVRSPAESWGDISTTNGSISLTQNLNLGNMAMIAANLALFCLLAFRWAESGHFPLSNLYESLMFLSWTCTSIHIFLLNTTSLDKLLGSLLAPAALFLNAFATFSLPKEMQQAGPLVPALQSNWLMMHVTVMIISYAALMLGSLLSIAFLIYKRSGHSSSEATRILESKTSGLTQSPIEANLDYLSYRIIGIGFPFLTIGILSGAVWANEAWGSYWSWDPKETWALLTWLVFAIYLHTRINKGWEGEKPAFLASFGFLVVWMCYLGVNLLGEGLHSYGFLN